MNKETKVSESTDKALHIAGVGTRYFSILKMTDSRFEQPINFTNLTDKPLPNQNLMKFEVADDLAYQTEEDAIKAMEKLPKPACYIIQPIWVCL